MLLLSNMYPSGKTPSFGVFVQNIEKNLLSAGVEVERVVIAGDAKNKFTKMIRYCWFILKACIKLLLSDKLVYVHYISHTGFPVFLISKLKGVRVISHVHGGDVIPTKDESLRTKRIKKYISYKVFDTSHKVIVPSSWLKEYIIEEYGVPHDIVMVSPSGGVNLNLFSPKKHFVKSDVIKLGFAGRLDKGKGADTLLRALSILQIRFECQIIGSGEERERLETFCSELNLCSDVKFCGIYGQEDLATFYRSIDLFVFPTELNESLGLVGIEAMASGTPIIAPLRAGITEYFEPSKNGFQFEHGNVESLADAIHQAASMTADDYLYFCQNSVETANYFDSVKVSKELVRELQAT